MKLARLPERVPVRITISVSPDLHRRLVDYAGLYEETYGDAETVAELIPAIVSNFLDADRDFARRRRESLAGGR